VTIYLVYLSTSTSNQGIDTTGVLTISKVDITSFTPRSSPRVSYDPVTSRVRGVTNELNGVVNSESTLRSLHNTSSVVLPWLSIAADGERHLGQRVVDSLFISSDGDDLADVNSRSASTRSTTSIASSVRVTAVGVEAVSLNPLESFTRVSSAASSIGSIAIYDFLRRSIRNTSSSHQIGRFGFFSGRESPAGTTLFLVLYRGGLSGGNPVDGTSRSFQLGLRGLSYDGLIKTNTEESSELLDRPVGELCVTERSARAVLVGCGDLGSGLDEGLELGITLSLSGVCSVPVKVKLLEGNFVGETIRSVVVGTKGQNSKSQAQEQ